MSTEAALERVRALAQSWATLPGDDAAAEVDRRVGTWLLGILDVEPAQALEGARILAEGWERPGGPGLFYPAAGQAVLDAIRGASTEGEAGWRSRAEAAEAKLAALDATLPEGADRPVTPELLTSLGTLWDVTWNKIATLESDLPGHCMMTWNDVNAVDEVAARIELLLYPPTADEEEEAPDAR